jgi:para-nitrobenzyl esterase
MVYIHGGGFSGGSGSSPLYDGVALCKRGDVLVVTLNHRLNVFGYLFLQKLGGERFAGSGNAGQLDLVLALEWVRDNIERFGGDPQRVMLFGQSGGGAKIATLLAMPRARSLFHRAITMSGQQLTASAPNGATRRPELARRAEAGCDEARRALEATVRKGAGGVARLRSDARLGLALLRTGVGRGRAAAPPLLSRCARALARYPAGARQRA